MVPQKHRDAKKFIYNSGFYITTNEYPDFGDGLDGEAIKKRLKIFHTKSLPRKDLSVTGTDYFLKTASCIFCISIIWNSWISLEWSLIIAYGPLVRLMTFKEFFHLLIGVFFLTVSAFVKWHKFLIFFRGVFRTPQTIFLKFGIFCRNS